MVDPRAKVAGIASLVVITVLTWSFARLLLIFLVFLALLLASRVPITVYISKVWLVPAFTLVVMLPHIFITSLDYVMAFTLRVYLAVSLLILLTLTTPFRDILGALRFYGVPNTLLLVLATTYRYVHLMFDELHRMLLARESRRVGRMKYRKLLEHGGHMLGAFFIRAYERGERVHLAMVSRGYDGSFSLPARVNYRRAHTTAFVIVVICTVVAWALI